MLQCRTMLLHSLVVALSEFPFAFWPLRPVLNVKLYIRKLILKMHN